VQVIDDTLLDDASANLGAGNVFKTGFNAELDEYLEAKFSGKNWITDYQNKQKQETNIPSLKVGFNNVFGYYIDVTKVHTAKVPSNYERKQTLTNSERYTTTELKQIEAKIFAAEEKIDELENRLFNDLKSKITVYTEVIQQNAQLVSAIDCLQSFAQTAVDYNYCRPEIDDSENIDINKGRHPVVEKLLPAGTSFTPNDTLLNTDEEQIHIITGPNMSGKSCYLRQVALIVLLGQIGSYVPAESAKFGIVDRIFTRVGAQDNITAGESTFLVEMQEAANILNNATKKSLILLDEVGRGTATFDGISIAWAIAEYIHNDIQAKTLFATHYHELNELSERYSRVINYQVEVVEAGNDIIFSHKVKKGASNHSFGIYVARMAGMPYDVVERAEEILKGLEGTKTQPDLNTIDTKEDPNDNQLAIFELRDDKLREKIKKININNLTPVQALQILSDMHKEVKKRK
jgi:DNA mismatch repair protein MutS